MSVKSELNSSKSTALVPAQTSAFIPVQQNVLMTKMPSAMSSMMASAKNLQISFMMLQKKMTHVVDASQMARTMDTISQSATEANYVLEEVKHIDQAQQGVNQKVKLGAQNMHNFASGVKNMAIRFIDLDMGKIIQMSDAMSLLKVRLNNINDGLQSTDVLNHKIYRSAQKTRTDYTEMADIMVHLGTLSKDAFVSNEDMLYFAEQMNKQFKLGAMPLNDQKIAMDQLMQSMASGTVQVGTMQTIMRTAPGLANAIASYMGVLPEELTNMASEGLITSDTIKNAMYTVAEETNKKFKDLPVTFSQIGIIARNALYKNLMPVIGLLGRGAQIIYQNWVFIEPLLYGIVAACIAYAVAQNIANIATTIGMIKSGIYTGFIIAKSVAMAILALATGNATLAQQALNTAIAANPLGVVLLIIGLVIMAIVAWVRSVGGIKIAWLIFVNFLLTTLETIHLVFLAGKYKLGIFINHIKTSFMQFGVSLRLLIAGIKANFLMGLEVMLNSAIKMINMFIKSINRITGTTFELIEQVSFGSKAKVEYEAYKKKEIEDFKKHKLDQSKKEATWREQNDRIELKYKNMQAQRMLEIEELQNEQALKHEEEKKYQSDNDELLKNKLNAEELGTVNDYGSTIAQNTGTMAESIKMSEEDLSSLRSMAEQDVINRFTTAEIKLDMYNSFGDIRETADLDGIFEEMERRATESLSIAAEGAH